MVESDWDFKKLPTHLLSDLKTTTTTNSHQLIPSTSTLNSFNSLHSIPSNHLILSSSSSSASSSSTPDSNPIDRLPNELLLEIFRALPSLDHSNDLLSPPLVSRKWRGPAQIVLWEYLRLPDVECVTAFAHAAKLRPDLAALARRLNFFTDDHDYLASLDADAVFSAMESLTRLERFEVTVPYAMGDLYDSLCEELSGSSIKQVFLSADEGIGRRHVQASMRFPTLNLLHLVRLGNLGDLISLAADWPCPPTLNQLVLVKPDLPGSDFEFLLNHTRPMLRTLRVDFGDLTIEDTQLTEEEVTNALIKFGDQLTTLEILWPHASFPLLNQAVRGLNRVEEIITSGMTWDEEMDGYCSPSLKSITLQVDMGVLPFQAFEKLYDPQFRRSNLTIYKIITRTDDQRLDSLQSIVWSEDQIQAWRTCAQKLHLVGIHMSGDFF